MMQERPPPGNGRERIGDTLASSRPPPPRPGFTPLSPHILFSHVFMMTRTWGEGRGAWFWISVMGGGAGSRIRGVRYIPSRSAALSVSTTWRSSSRSRLLRTEHTTTGWGDGNNLTASLPRCHRGLDATPGTTGRTGISSRARLPRETGETPGYRVIRRAGITTFDMGSR